MAGILTTSHLMAGLITSRVIICLCASRWLTKLGLIFHAVRTTVAGTVELSPLVSDFDDGGQRGVLGVGMLLFHCLDGLSVGTTGVGGGTFVEFSVLMIPILG